MDITISYRKVVKHLHSPVVMNFVQLSQASLVIKGVFLIEGTKLKRIKLKADKQNNLCVQRD